MNIGDQIPIDTARRIRDMERSATEKSAARLLDAATIGNGGLLTCNGSLIVNGSLTVPAGSLNTAASIGAGTFITAGTSITAGTQVNANSLSISTNAVIGGALGVTGALNAASCALSGNLSAANVLLGASGTLFSTYAYNTPVVTSYLAAYINGPDGRFGATPSARRFKQDITAKVYTVTEAVRLSALVVNYRLIEAVAMYDDAAPTEVGVIAESLIDAGFSEFVAFDADGNTLSVHYERLCLVVMGAFAELVGRLEALESAR
jgi:hypothetical protein